MHIASSIFLVVFIGGIMTASAFLVPAQCVNARNIGNYLVSKKKLSSSSSSNKNDYDTESKVQEKIDDKVETKHETFLKSNVNQRPVSLQKKKKRNYNKKKNHANRAETGYIPNIRWRAIPNDHLRMHPLFDALPQPYEIDKLESIEDVKNFRQGSIQWELLHDGRCTTSRAAGALGILEQKAAKELNIPKSLRKRGTRAYDHLRGRALRNIDEMEYVLCQQSNDYIADYKENSEQYIGNTEKIWSANDYVGDFSFMAKYLPRPTLPKSEKNRNKENGWSLLQARVSWGSVQEPIAVLTALNYFCKKFPGTRLKEIGMCVGETSGHAHKLEESNLLIGASPDAIIEYPDRTLTVLEVKNHCPFTPIRWRKNGMSHENTRFYIGSRTPPGDVPATYVPQLMLQMLCLGPSCQSAVMVRQTATKGAAIIEIKRGEFMLLSIDIL